MSLLGNKQEGTLFIWYKPESGVLSDGITRNLFAIAADAGGNFIWMRKMGSADTFNLTYRAATTDKSVTFTNALAGWNNLALTWSKAADEMKAYLNGVQVGSTQTGLGTWSGALFSTLCTVGAQTTTPTFIWSGWLAHAAVWNTPLTPTQISSLNILS